MQCLKTDYEKDLNNNIPWQEYPRPQLKRDSYLSLNGKWNFKIRRDNKDIYDGEILLPFVPESRISGVFKYIEKNDIMIYEREFEVSEEFLYDILLIHFGACDQYAKVYVNGSFAGGNVGGYLPFSLDITKFINKGKNVVRVEARDPLNLDLPYGKQSEKSKGMWYTKISGIWQSVWLESVCEDYIKNIKITPDLNGVSIKVSGGKNEKTILFDGREYTFTGEEFYLNVDNPVHWTPDNPHLYDFKIKSGEDEVSSYFGLRTVSIGMVNETPYILLNDKPVFLHGLLDQGYFADGIFLPSSERGFKEDICTLKDCGFNMLRKHIKLEPEIFYYYCDKYGILVFQDIINSGKYSYIMDTALATLFVKKGISHRASKFRKIEFEKTALSIVDKLYNHPSVIYYTIFNEGWGQFKGNYFYKLLKKKDPTRIYDTASGWYKVKDTDVESQHIYFKTVEFSKKYKKPLVLSEFGGYSYKIPEHSFNQYNNYGYGSYNTQADYEDALIKLYTEQIVPSLSMGLCGSVYTQVSDVEDETNGLLTYDRKVLKVNKDRIKEMSEKLYEEFEKLVSL